MCRQPKGVFTVCCHTKHLETEVCIWAKLIVVFEHLFFTLTNWLSSYGPSWIRHTITDDYRIEYGFCDTCTEYYTIYGKVITVQAVLNYWEAKSIAGMRHPVVPPAISRQVIFPEVEFQKIFDSFTSERLELITLSESLHIWDDPETFRKSTAYKQGNSNPNLFEYLEFIRWNTLEWARKNKARHLCPSPSHSPYPRSLRLRMPGTDTVINMGHQPDVNTADYQKNDSNHQHDKPEDEEVLSPRSRRLSSMFSDAVDSRSSISTIDINPPVLTALHQVLAEGDSDLSDTPIRTRKRKGKVISSSGTFNSSCGRITSNPAHHRISRSRKAAQSAFEPMSCVIETMPRADYEAVSPLSSPPLSSKSTTAGAHGPSAAQGNVRKPRESWESWEPSGRADSEVIPEHLASLMETGAFSPVPVISSPKSRGRSKSMKKRTLDNIPPPDSATIPENFSRMPIPSAKRPHIAPKSPLRELHPGASSLNQRSRKLPFRSEQQQPPTKVVQELRMRRQRSMSVISVTISATGRKGRPAPKSAPPFPLKARGFEEVAVCFCYDLGKEFCVCPNIGEPAGWL